VRASDNAFTSRDVHIKRIETERQTKNKKIEYGIKLCLYHVDHIVDVVFCLDLARATFVRDSSS
jgi:hypothetical protein